MPKAVFIKGEIHLTSLNYLNHSSVLIYFGLECSSSGLHNLFYLMENI